MKLLLITILMLFVFNQSANTTADHDKSVKRKTAFSYDDEPAICEMAFYRYGGCYCKDDRTKDRRTKKIIKRYGQFKKQLARDTSKILLITHNQVIDIQRRTINSTVHCYGLPANQTYFAMDTLQKRTVRVEILARNHPKIKTDNIISKDKVDAYVEDCSVCGF